MSYREVCTLTCEATHNGRTRHSFKMLGTASQLRDADWLREEIKRIKSPILKTHRNKVTEIFLEILPAVIPNSVEHGKKTRLPPARLVRSVKRRS